MPAVASATSTVLTTAWAATCRDPATTTAVASWATTHPALRDCTTLSDVTTAMAPRAEADPAWAAVIQLAQTGDQLAVQTLIHALLPQYRGIARRCAPTHTGGDVDEALALTLHGLLEHLPRYDTGRRHHHSNNLGLTGLKHLTRSTRSRIAHPRYERPTEDLEQHTATSNDHVGESTREIDRVERADQVERLLRWASAHRIITADEAGTLARMYAGPAYRGSAELRTAGHSSQTLRQRHARALRKLRAALTGPLAQDLIGHLAA